MRSPLDKLSSHRTSGESGGSPTNHPSLSEMKLRGVARTGLHILLIHGEVFPLVLAGLVGKAPLSSASALGRCSPLACWAGGDLPFRQEGSGRVSFPQLFPNETSSPLSAELQHALSAGCWSLLQLQQLDQCLQDAPGSCIPGF